MIITVRTPAVLLLYPLALSVTIYSVVLVNGFIIGVKMMICVKSQILVAMEESQVRMKILELA